VIDLLSILLFFVILNEDDKFSITFSFFIGLLLDLYYPVTMGLNIFILLVLSQALVFIRKYFVHEPLTIIIVFVLFYSLRILLLYIFSGKFIGLAPMFFTIIACLPVTFLLQRLCFKVWMRI
jgi:rod shape-determining protein MreD